MAPMSMTNFEVIIAHLQKQNIELKEALREAVEWLDNAPLDYSNGNIDSTGTIDEGEYYGWKAHRKMVNRFKQLLGIFVSDLEQCIENMGDNIDIDDMPF